MSVSEDGSSSYQGVVQNLRIQGNTLARKSPSCEGRISVNCKVVMFREAAGLAASGSLGLKRTESQQREPMRARLTCH